MGNVLVVAVHLIDLGIFVVSVYRPPSYTSQENHSLIHFFREFSVGREV